MFPRRWASLVVLGIATIHGFCASSQARSIWAGVAPLRTAQSCNSCTSGMLAARLSRLLRGNAVRRSSCANRKYGLIVPVVTHALGHEVLHRVSDILDRDSGIYPVLVEQVDVVRPEALQHAVDGPANVFRAAVQAVAGPRVRAAVPAELGRDHHVVADGAEGIADDTLRLPRPVRLGRVEERPPWSTAVRMSATMSLRLVTGP